MWWIAVRAFALGGTDSDSSYLNRHDGASHEFVFVSRKRGNGRYAVVSGAEIHKTNNPDVWSPLDDREFTEVFVESDQDLRMAEGVRQYILVAWVARPISDHLDVVSCGGEDLARAAPDATVEKPFTR